MIADYLCKMDMPWDYWLSIICSIGGLTFLIICKICKLELVGVKNENNE